GPAAAPPTQPAAGDQAGRAENVSIPVEPEQANTSAPAARIPSARSTRWETKRRARSPTPMPAPTARYTPVTAKSDRPAYDSPMAGTGNSAPIATSARNGKSRSTPKNAA